MNNLLHDIRYAVRQLRKNPGFTYTAILTLVLGICASVSIFAFVDVALIKPLPYANPDRLVEVTGSVPIMPRANLSYPDYLDWKRLNQVFSSMDVYSRPSYLLRTPDGTKPVSGVRVSDGFFRTLGVTPTLGRDFYTGEDLPEAPRTVILSYRTWLKRFEGGKDVLGATLILSGTPYTVIGVLPPDFQFAPGGNAEFWTTLHATGSCDVRRSCHGLTGIGRLKDGVSTSTALANMQAITRQLELQYPNDNRGQTASVIPLSEAIVGNIRRLLLALLCGAGLLFAIACVNVSSLLLVRSESRRREIAVRGAVGASRSRLVRQFVTEGLVLMTVSSALGLVFAREGMQILAGLISKGMMASMPYLSGLSLNLHVLAFAIALSVLAAGVFSVVPIMRLPLAQLRAGMAEGNRGSAGMVLRRFGANLVAVELAIAVVLLVGAGLLGKSLYRLLHVELGFQADHLATVDVELPETTYEKDEEQARVGREIVSRVGTLPGVSSVGISNVLPVSFNGNTTWIRVSGRAYYGEHNEVLLREVSSAFFTTLHAKLSRGRYFTEAEDASKPRVVIINQSLAKQYFSGENPIGKRIGDKDLTPQSIAEIIGVIEDVKDGSLDSEIWPAVYYPFNQSPDTYFSLVVRTAQGERGALPSLVAAVRDVDPGIGTLNEAAMSDRIDDSPAAYLHRSSAWLVGGFASVALLLGVVGLYGVIAYSVSRRTREIGVRMALGAQRSSVYQLIMREAAWLTCTGIAAGIVCSLAVATLLRGLLFSVRTWDATTLISVATVLAISALLASYIPARRAARVDPIVALRCE